MTPAQQFKLGFITRCLEEGLTAEMVEERIKQADLKDFIPTSWSGAAGGAGAALGTAGAFASPVTAPLAYTALGGAALLGGGYVGNQLGKSFSSAKLVNPVDVKEVQHQEIMQALAHHRKRMLSEMARQGAQPSQLQAAM